MNKPKKVLIICYYWPPAGGPGVQRWLKFATYLTDFGIEPVVYVPENASYPIVDKELKKEVPKGLKVLKKPIREPYGFARLLSRKHTKNISSGILPEEKKQSSLQKLLLYIRGNFFIPDARIGWVKPSVKFLTSYIENSGIDAIITTGPPHSMHLIGEQLKDQNPSINWIADFRDPWTTIGYHSKLKMTARAQNKHKRLEKEVLDGADHIIVTSPRTKADFGIITQTPITTITNGYDTKINETLKLNNHFTISHIGSLLSGRNPTILWSVLSKIIATNIDFRSSFKLSLAGRVSATVLDSIKDFGLDKYLSLEGYISHGAAIQLQQRSNLLLLIEIDSKETQSIIPGKLFEYLAARRPILAIGPTQSDVKHIISETEAGSYHSYSEETQIEKAILRHFMQYQEGTASLNTGKIDQYHRRSLTQKLSNIIVS